MLSISLFRAKIQTNGRKRESKKKRGEEGMREWEKERERERERE